MKKLLLLSALLIFACSSDSEGNPCIYEPTLSTEAVTDITETSATLNGIIAIVSENCDVPNNAEQGFVYSTEIQPTLEDTQVNVNGTNISTTIEGLTPNTTYYVRAFLTNNLGDFYGDEVSFTTEEEITASCDGEPYQSIVYGTQEWTVENACHTTYRDGTPIPEVTDLTEWANLTTGAWTYSFNEFNVTSKLYNWYAIEGIHDNNPNTPNKEFSPEGWHVPSDDEWTTLQDFLVDNGHSYNLSCSWEVNYEKDVAKAMASTYGWDEVAEIWDDWDKTPGGNQILNNSSGFNALPVGAEFGLANGYVAIFWTSTGDASFGTAYYLEILSDYVCTDRGSVTLSRGYSVRLVKD
jgi:uncharacterized protein (TIGR02145 family)